MSNLQSNLMQYFSTFTSSVFIHAHLKANLPIILMPACVSRFVILLDYIQGNRLFGKGNKLCLGYIIILTITYLMPSDKDVVSWIHGILETNYQQ